MNYKIYLYALMLFVSIFMISGINFEKFMRSGKVMEAKFLIMALSIGMAYLLTNFIWDFLNL